VPRRRAPDRGSLRDTFPPDFAALRQADVFVRIAIISSCLIRVPPRNYGGTERVVAELVDGLLATGHEVTLYATGDARTAADLRWLYPRALGIATPDLLSVNHAAFACYDIARENAFDVVHAHIPEAIFFTPVLPAPVVYTAHNSDVGLLRALASFHEQINAVAISRDQARRLPFAHPSVIHHGRDPRAFPIGRGQGGYAAFVGLLAPWKGPHVALDVAARARVPIRLGGIPRGENDPYYLHELKPRFRRKGVTFVGGVSHRPKVAMLRSAIATLFPIDWNEPFGLVMVESMLCGTPVLAFRRGSVPEVIDDGITGWIVRDEGEMAERLRWLASPRCTFDRARCRALAVKRFGRDRMVADHVKLYRDLARENSRGKHRAR
jgi:glycosyltransferase involved in cell wall biosynthesis